MPDPAVAGRPEPLPPGATIGILGGGQLARMMAMAAARLGYRTIVLDPARPCPAAQVCNDQIVADYDDPSALDQLADRCDVVTYEFENVPALAGHRLAEQVRLHPDVRALEVSQDRLEEKQFLRSIGIETARFAPVSNRGGLRTALADFGTDVIVKTRRFGYDGKGQLRIPAGGDVPDLVETLGTDQLIAEAVVDFVAEISVIAARSIDGRICCFEPAVNTHRDGILSSSVVPSGLDRPVIDRAVGDAGRLLDALEYVGVLGLELFVLADGAVLANEFAPRVHNSGHWTELVSTVDQFEQHVRAITGHPLGDPTHAPCEMINLIGDDVERVERLVADGGWRVHLYGKDEVRPGRKMGHATRLRRND
jgi:5-(carboxyamino)imidazole ribonucleotide synthase